MNELIKYEYEQRKFYTNHIFLDTVLCLWNRRKEKY